MYSVTSLFLFMKIVHVRYSMIVIVMFFMCKIPYAYMCHCINQWHIQYTRNMCTLQYMCTCIRKSELFLLYKCILGIDFDLQCIINQLTLSVHSFI